MVQLVPLGLHKGLEVVMEGSRDISQLINDAGLLGHVGRAMKRTGAGSGSSRVMKRTRAGSGSS